MGRVKEHWMHYQSLGISPIDDKYVCAACIETPEIREFIRDQNSHHYFCDYCRKEGESVLAVEMNDVLEFIADGINSEFGDMVDLPLGLIKEGLVPEFDVGDVFEMLRINESNSDLHEDLLSAFDLNIWRDRYLLESSPSQFLRWGWERFSEAVKYHFRYTFFRYEEAEEDFSYEFPSPKQFLEHLGRTVERTNLCRTLPQGTEFYRARIPQNGELLSTEKELGPPSKESAIYSNRMSPAGIPMFYCACDEHTARVETFDQSGESREVVIGQFTLKKEIQVIDFTRLPPVLSPLDQKRDMRHDLMFLHHFCDDLKKSVEKDSKEHIDYVPTQIVSEYFRHIYGTADVGEKVDGMLYKSARKGGGISCVFFVDAEKYSKSPFSEFFSLVDSRKIVIKD